VVKEENENTCIFHLHCIKNVLNCLTMLVLLSYIICHWEEDANLLVLQLIDDCYTRHARNTLAELACLLDAQLEPDAMAHCYARVAMLAVDADHLNNVMRP
jgi:hypothetical protein